MRKFKKKLIHWGLHLLTKKKPLPENWQYRTVWEPWLKDKTYNRLFAQIRPYTLISPGRCYTLYKLGLQCRNLGGCWLECGVYKGGSAMLMAKILNNNGTILHLFDTFNGMPKSNQNIDLHKIGDFSDTSVEKVQELFRQEKFVRFHKGYMPDTFKPLESEKISFAHIDVDLYKSVYDCCAFIYPRLCIGGIIVFNDYGVQSCPGATKAVNDFFRNKNNVPFPLLNTQAILFKSS